MSMMIFTAIMMTVKMMLALLLLLQPPPPRYTHSSLQDIPSSAVRIFKLLNRIVTSVFDSIWNEHNYSKFLNTYRHQFLTYLTEWRRFFTLATTTINKHGVVCVV